MRKMNTKRSRIEMSIQWGEVCGGAVTNGAVEGRSERSVYNSVKEHDKRVVGYITLTIGAVQGCTRAFGSFSVFSCAGA